MEVMLFYHLLLQFMSSLDLLTCLSLFSVAPHPSLSKSKPIKALAEIRQVKKSNVSVKKAPVCYFSSVTAQIR